MRILILTFVALLLFVAMPARAQVLDGVYSKSKDTPHKKPVPYVQLREADIMWLTRVWRIVDMREKMNQVFYYPIKPAEGRQNFMYMLMKAIEMERIQAYSAYDSAEGMWDDTFKFPLTPSEAVDALTFTETIEEYDEYGDPIYVEKKDTIPLSDITRFKIKEEVFFDKQRSVMETRILGIAPMIPNREDPDNVLGQTEAFWIYFPEARTVFAEEEVYNRHNDVHRLTYDDVFWKRMFASTIVKVTNVYDRSIDRYKAPLDALLEAEEIENGIFNREHDLWSF